MRVYIWMLAALLQTGCSQDPPPTAAQAEAYRPADARLAVLYERSCLACHGRAGSGAPLTGDTAAWAPRLARGRELLLHNTRQGLGGMPQMGLCAECSDADLGALIDFMSRKQRP